MDPGYLPNGIVTASQYIYFRYDIGIGFNTPGVAVYLEYMGKLRY